MNPTVKNLIALVTGIIIGGLVNFGLIMISAYVIPPPPGVDNTTMEGLKEGMKLMEPRHFLFPFLAHALGTMVGAFVAAYLAANRKMMFALVVGGFFLAGGITSVLSLPSPLWFTLLDLGLAYLPMGWIGGKLGIAASGR